MAGREALGKRLRRIRVNRGFTPAEVAKQLGCHKSNVSHFERGAQNPTIGQLRILARLYGCSIDQLLDGPLPLIEKPRVDGAP